MAKRRKLSVGLVYDLRRDYLDMGFSAEAAAEFDSEETISILAETIRSLGYNVDRVGHAKHLVKRLASGSRWDIVFNVAEGVAGRSRESQVPAILEVYDIPCTFSDPLVCALTLDKAMAKRVLISAGLRTPAFAVISEPADIRSVRLKYPLFAKPVAEGTGKGVDSASRITSRMELDKVCRRLLRKFRQPVLVEEYLPGREFTVGILGTGLRSEVLGTIEIVVKGSKHKSIYSYTTKELCEKLVDYIPVPDAAIRKKVEALALASYRVLECRDGARVDIRIDHNGQPAFMEVNPLPGLHPTHSDLPMIATQEGMPYKELIGSILSSAIRRSNAGR